MGLIDCSPTLPPMGEGVCESAWGEWGGEERRSRLVHDLIAMPLLQALERGAHLLAVAVPARPQSQLPPARALQDRELDPQLGDRGTRLPLLDPRTDEAEELGRAAQWMAHKGVAFLGTTGFGKESHPHVLGAGAAQAELTREVAAERAGDKEQSLAVFDRRLELAMRARELRWQPRSELVRLVAAREQ